MEMKRISEKNLRVLRFIVNWKREHDGNSPNIRHIMTGLGYSTTSVPTHHINGLIEAGLLRRNPMFGGPLETIGGSWFPFWSQEALDMMRSKLPPDDFAELVA